jgi:hypothetical protein
MCVSSRLELTHTANVERETWNQDRTRRQSYRPTALAFSAKLGVLRRGVITGLAELSHCLAATRFAVTLSSAPENLAPGDRPLHVPSSPSLNLCVCSLVGFGGSSPCPSLRLLPCLPRSRSGGFRGLLLLPRRMRPLKLNGLREGGRCVIAGPVSPLPSAAAAQLAGWFQAANARHGFDSGIIRRAKRSSVDSGSGLGRLRCDLDERFSPFVLSHLSAGLRSHVILISQAKRPVRTRTRLSI